MAIDRKREQEDRKKEQQERKKTEKLFQEVAQAHKKTEEAQQETEKSLRELKETVKAQSENLEKTDVHMVELKEAVKEQCKNLDKARGDFTRKWGAFMEKLVKGNLIRLLQEKKIPVKSLVHNFKIEDENGNPLGDFDLTAINGDELVVVEVKTTLTHGKVTDFLQDLKDYRQFIPCQEGRTVYAAMACLDIGDNNEKEKTKYGKENCKDRAMREGLWVIQAPGGDADFAKIVNPEGFKPKEF